MAGAPGAVMVHCENLVHVYGARGAEVAALRGVDLEVRSGEMVTLLGASGSGKTTLLWHLAGLLRPSVGTVDVLGHRLAAMPPAELAEFRLREIGVVLQNAGRNLLPYLSVLGNVRAVQRRTRDGAAARPPMELLDAVGLAPLARRHAGRLSGGEKQRLALAVAMANGPALLLADEPTSQLDAASGADTIELIRAANRDFGTTIIVVTHDPAVATALGRTITIRDGRVGSAGHGGREFLVVGRDRSVQLPAEFADLLPAGSLLTAERLPDGIALRRIDPEAPDAPGASGLAR